MSFETNTYPQYGTQRNEHMVHILHMVHMVHILVRVWCTMIYNKMQTFLEYLFCSNDTRAVALLRCFGGRRLRRIIKTVVEAIVPGTST